LTKQETLYPTARRGRRAAKQYPGAKALIAEIRYGTAEAVP
jgi:hypothetical protein